MLSTWSDGGGDRWAGFGFCLCEVAFGQPRLTPKQTRRLRHANQCATPTNTTPENIHLDTGRIRQISCSFHILLFTRNIIKNFSIHYFIIHFVKRIIISVVKVSFEHC